VSTRPAIPRCVIGLTNAIVNRGAALVGATGVTAVPDRSGGSSWLRVWLGWVGANALATILAPIVATIAAVPLTSLAVYFTEAIYRPRSHLAAVQVGYPYPKNLERGVGLLYAGFCRAVIGWGVGTLVGWIQLAAPRKLPMDPKRWVWASRRGWEIGLPLGCALTLLGASRLVEGISAVLARKSSSRSGRWRHLP